MANKSVRGKIRDRLDYSELLLDMNNTEIPVEAEVPIETNTSCNEKRKDYWRMRSDEKVLFFYHKSENTVHDKHCDITKQIPLKDLKPLSIYKSNKKQCPHCALQTYLRIGAEDYKKHKEYDKLFAKMKADIYLIRKIYVDMRCTTRLTDASTIRIQYGNEAWKIKLLDSTGRVSLSHNDYKLHYDGTREKYYTYHIQNDRCKRTSIQNAINVIIKYKTHRPFSAYSKREQQVIKILKKNPKETQVNIAKVLGVSLSTVVRTIQSLKGSKTLKRIDGKRYGYWKITM